MDLLTWHMLSPVGMARTQKGLPTVGKSIDPCVLAACRLSALQPSLRNARSETYLQNDN